MLVGSNLKLNRDIEEYKKLLNGINLEEHSGFLVGWSINLVMNITQFQQMIDPVKDLLIVKTFFNESYREIYDLEDVYKLSKENDLAKLTELKNLLKIMCIKYED